MNEFQALPESRRVHLLYKVQAPRFLFGRLMPKRPKRLLSEPILAHVESSTVQLFGLLRGARTMHEHCRRAVHVKSHEINGWSVSQVTDPSVTMLGRTLRDSSPTPS